MSAILSRPQCVNIGDIECLLVNWGIPGASFVAWINNYIPKYFVRFDYSSLP